MVVLFFAGQPVAKVAIIGGALLLFNRQLKADRVYREIDWPLLVMFVGLFIVVTGLETTVLTPDMIAVVGRLHLDTVPVLSAVTAGLSNLVSNVPAVLVLKPFVANLQDPQRAWLIVAMASTLAGNLTLVGSVANLIVTQRARAHNVTIGFWEYFKVGAPNHRRENYWPGPSNGRQLSFPPKIPRSSVFAASSLFFRLELKFLPALLI